MSLILQNALNGLILPSPTYILVNGTLAQLSRYEYINPYINQVNFQQYVPIIFFNIVTNSLQMSNTESINFTKNDIFTANDWTILNQTIYQFTALITSGSNVLTNPSIILSVGQYITGYGIPNGTTVTSISMGIYTISNNATITSATPITLSMTLT